MRAQAHALRPDPKITQPPITLSEDSDTTENDKRDAFGFTTDPPSIVERGKYTHGQISSETEHLSIIFSVALRPHIDT